MLQSRIVPMSALLAATAAVACAVGLALAGEPESPQRAARPTFPPDVKNVFFDDAREQLVGDRPHVGTLVGPAAPGQQGGNSADVPARFAWSQLISGETIADEIKRIANGLQAPLANAAKFRSGGYQQCRDDFSVLAVLFSVTAEFDDEMRFQDEAAVLRDAFARAGANCQIATDDSFAEARQRQIDLEDLLRGQTVMADRGAAENLPAFSDLADLPILMRRMEAALNQRVKPALGNDRTFRKQDLDVRREAQILALLAEVIQRENFDNRDDEDYAAFAKQLREAAAALNGAATDGNYEAARSAAGRAGQACTQCHEYYRG